jgi:hypothetical protein
VLGRREKAAVDRRTFRQSGHRFADKNLRLPRTTLEHGLIPWERGML